MRPLKCAVRQKNKSMKLITDIKKKLQYYINNNEVVYQFCGELVEVSNETMLKKKNALLDSFKRVNLIEMYGKHNSFLKDGWPELTEWSTDDDVLFLLDGIGMLICIPQKEALDNNLIVA